jgi:hypothetical protein
MVETATAQARTGQNEVDEWIVGAIAAARPQEVQFMSDIYEDGPVAEAPEPYLGEDAAEIVSLDSEVDFDDEADSDQLPLDIVEASERGVLLDDPEILSSLDDDA